MIHVYTGPTLPPGEPALASPDVRVLPPARHGDLFDRRIQAGDTVLIIDGVYHQAPALRHKEILAAMARGVHVIGAASIGALRAAELYSCGMVGVGTVWRSYMRGEIDGDDEVAVGQAPDGSFRSLTWPLVNLRFIVGMAQQAHVLGPAEAAALLRELREVYYPQRTSVAVTAVSRRLGAECFADWFTGGSQKTPAGEM